jgi:MFS family permease
MLAGAGIVQLTLVLPYRLPLYLVGALLLGFCAQGLKICVDTLVQRCVDDEFRGRVFALYDMLFNVAVVTAAVMVALVLPADGYAPVSVIVIGLAYLATAFVYTRLAGTDATLTRPAAEPTSV